MSFAIAVATKLVESAIDPDNDPAVPFAPGEDEFLDKAAELSGEWANTLGIKDVIQFGMFIAEMSEWVGLNFTYNNKENS